MALIGGNQVSQFTKVFYANFGFIFDSIELEQTETDFYDLARDKQWKLIVEKVKEIENQIEVEQPEPQMGDINSTDKTDKSNSDAKL